MTLNDSVRSSSEFSRIHAHIQTRGNSSVITRVRTQGGGMLDVFPNQELVALYIKTVMQEAYQAGCSSSIVVLAHPQSGKTTCETRAIEMIDDVVKAGIFPNLIDVGRYHHAGEPKRTLIQQTGDRLPAGVMIVTAQDITWKQGAQTRRGKQMLSKLQLNLAAGYEIALHDDEVHLNRKDAGSFNQFLSQKLGIPSYGQPPTMWNQRHVHIVGYSASPFGHLMHVGQRPGVYTVIYMRPGYGYYSLNDIYRAGRIKNVSEKVVLKRNKIVGGLSPEFIDACNEFLATPSPGYFFVRNRYDFAHAVPLIRNFFQKHGIQVHEAISAKPGSIEKCKFNLSQSPKTKEVWLIQKAFGAGDTLCQDHIISVWEGGSDIKRGMDHRLQELGRWCGYKINSRMRIYASHHVVEEIIQFWDAIEQRLQYQDGAEALEQTVLNNIVPNLPSGTANHSGKDPKTPKHKPGTVFQ